MKFATHHVALIRRGLELLVDPNLGLVAVALEHLELVGLLQQLPAHGRLVVQHVTALQQLKAKRRKPLIFSACFLLIHIPSPNIYSPPPFWYFPYLKSFSFF